MKNISTRFDTRESDLNRVDSINNYRTESYLRLRTELFAQGTDIRDFTGASVDFLNALTVFYRVVKEHGENEDKEKVIEEKLEEAEKNISSLQNNEYIEKSLDELKEVEELLTEIEDLINELRRDVGLTITETDKTPEGEELI